MDERTLRDVAEIIARKRINLTDDEARMLATRAVRFKKETGRLPSITSPDPWERQWRRASRFSSARRQQMSEKSDLDILAELGVEPLRKTKTAQTPREARIIAGFEDIQKFVAEHGRAPRHGSDRDIFERLYAVRLDRLRSLQDCRALLSDIDHRD